MFEIGIILFLFCGAYLIFARLKEIKKRQEIINKRVFPPKLPLESFQQQNVTSGVMYSSVTRSAFATYPVSYYSDFRTGFQEVPPVIAEKLKNGGTVLQKFPNVEEEEKESLEEIFMKEKERHLII